MENENLNQPTNNPVTTPVQPQPQSVSTSITNHKGFLPLVFGILVLLVAVAGGAYYLGTKNSQITPQSNIQPTTMPQNEIGANPTVSPTSGSSQADKTANWNTYADATYTFKYPKDWTVKPGSKETEEYFQGDYVEIIAPSPTVSIQISPSQPPYGFGGPMETKFESISINTNQSTYESKESTRVENGITKSFVDLAIPHTGKEYHVLFGTGYPVNDDQNSSYSDYQQYKDTILEILSTLTIK